MYFPRKENGEHTRAAKEFANVSRILTFENAIISYLRMKSLIVSLREVLKMRTYFSISERFNEEIFFNLS